MSFTNSFSAQQSIGLPNIILLTDTSAGSDGAISGRRIYLQKSDGLYLTPVGTTTSYINWPTGSYSIPLDVLTTDMALNVIVQWVNSGGAPLYTSETLYVFTLYNEEFDYGLTSTQSADYKIVNDTEYYNNRIKLRVEIDNAQNAVSIGSDITSSQYSCDRASYLRLNQSLYF